MLYVTLQTPDTGTVKIPEGDKYHQIIMTLVTVITSVDVKWCADDVHIAA